jgi:hypothetical protein
MMPRNIYNPNKTPEQRRLQNERAMRLLDKWGNEPEMNCDYAAVEAEFEVAADEFQDNVSSSTRAKHVPLA